MGDDIIAHASAGWERARELSTRIVELETELARVWEHAHKLDDALQHHVRVLNSTTYQADALAVWNKAVPFMTDPRFLAAYEAGMHSGYRTAQPKGSEVHVEWRVHVLCWAAQHAARLAGDFVECGVNTGAYALAVCRYVDFNRLDRDFWLFDTFTGISVGQAEASEREEAVAESAAPDNACYELAQSSFAPYPRAHLVRGTVPETLATVNVERVAYLSIDTSPTFPGRASIEHFWPRLVSGGVVVLDDYGLEAHAPQRNALDDFARGVGVEILTLPTGQGLLVKP